MTTEDTGAALAQDTATPATEAAETFPVAKLRLVREPTDDEVHMLAALANDANAGYCASLGDFTYGPWEGVPPAIQDSICDGVVKHLANPELTPEESHEAWREFKAAQGYVYGPIRDEEHRLHPCMVPYKDLPQSQRSKDFIFKAVVISAAKQAGLL